MINIHPMRLYLEKFLMFFIFSFLFGAIIDLLIGHFVGFTLILPVTIFIILLVIQMLHIENPFLIIGLTILFFLFAMIIGFYQFIELRDNSADMSGALYLIGFKSSLILGFIFGFFIVRRINT